MFGTGTLKTVVISLSVVVGVVLCFALPFLYVRLRRRCRAHRTQQLELQLQIQNKLNDVTQLSHDDVKYVRENHIAPPKHLSAPGYIALYTPSSRTYSSFNEFHSDFDSDRKWRSTTPSPAHTPRPRTAAVLLESNPSGAQRRARLQFTHRSDSGASLPSPPDPHSDLLYVNSTELSAPNSPRSLNSASRVNMNSISVTV